MRLSLRPFRILALATAILLFPARTSAQERLTDSDAIRERFILAGYTTHTVSVGAMAAGALVITMTETFAKAFSAVICIGIKGGCPFEHLFHGTIVVPVAGPFIELAYTHDASMFSRDAGFRASMIVAGTIQAASLAMLIGGLIPRKKRVAIYPTLSGISALGHF